MKKAILSRFTTVILLALILSSMISYYAMGREMLEQNIGHLTNLLKVIDCSMDYSGDLQMQINERKDSMDERIRITILDQEGKVWADTDTSAVGLENHLEREEIQMALKSNLGYATRYSETIRENMLYAAQRSEHSGYILRIAIPFTGIKDYLRMIFPMLLLGVAVAFLISIVIGIRFTETVTEPLYEISMEMEKAHGEELDFHFKQYKYEELNIISDATMKLSKEIRDRICQVENERKIRQEFFSNASHELKTPITAIRGYAELLDNGFAQDEETKKNFIRRIVKTAENMTNLINDILMISRLETKEAVVTFSEVRMNPMVEDVFEALEPIAADYQVSLHRECEPVVVTASAKQLHELFMNLVGNGIKYNKPGGNVWVTVRRKGETLQIEVRDDGVGIPKEDQDRIFQRFYRVDKGRSRKMGGTGLGLSIVKHIVEYYDGSICLKSKLGEGSTFFVSIPMENMQKNEEKHQIP
ncbi:MAG: two-component sensor histidine kinase [Clostridiales bacterium]|nr:two-component sensor histidine kinase [Clostridiales bacterium]